MDNNIQSCKVIVGRGIVDFMSKCKEAENQGWILYGNPMMSDNIISQVVVKEKESIPNK